MSTPERVSLGALAGDPWGEVARRVEAWAAGRGLELRDTIVLVPFVQLLPEARRAFAARSGWMPRIETTRTLAASFGPPGRAGPDAPTLDGAADRLRARRMLLGESWGARWAARDPRGFDHAVARLVAATHELAAAAAAQAPVDRDPWWSRAETSILAGGTGPGRRELDLAAIALRWASLAATPSTDRLFALAPVAWIAVEAGGADPLVEAVFAASPAPALVLEADPLDPDRIDFSATAEAPAVVVCASFEDEAEAATAQILEHLSQGLRPVALVAQDRLLVRRVRALLARAGTSIVDETGWKLSTTRAAAGVMRLLASARPDASSDEFFDWLKSATCWRDLAPNALAALEAAARRAGASRLEALAAMRIESADARALREGALATLQPLRAARTMPLSAWRSACRAALDRSGAMAMLEADAAGVQLLSVLGLDPEPLPETNADADASTSMSLADFTRWADDVLEDETFRPAADADPGAEGADVYVTPLPRVMLRPFAAALLPGADQACLGAWTADDSLLSFATREALGLELPAARLRRERVAFAHLLAVAPLTLLRRRADHGEPLAASAFVEQLGLALAAQQRTWRIWRDPRVRVELVPAPVRRSAAMAPSLVPQRLSATAVEALRACPYRFFALTMLGLKAADELDGDLGKRDYGSWLHAVLHLFHAERAEARSDAAGDADVLRAAGAAIVARDGLPAADFLPWQATFDAFVPRYVAWLHEREAGGARWRDGEVALSDWPAALGGVELYGIVDRVDEIRREGAPAIELIDYKTGSADKWKKKVGDGFEDTQLAFYAALVGASSDAPLKASYLALESRPALQAIEHVDVATSAQALVEGIAVDLSRLRGGAPLVALGEGEACTWCEARGLCRRDQWSDAEDTARPADASGGDDALARDRA